MSILTARAWRVRVVGSAARDWLGYALQYGSFAAGALLGGVLGEIVGGEQMLLVAAAAAGIGILFTARATRTPLPAT
ncbi:hypothetical protein [Nocardia sp. SSK8]|uniref:hypothetical protein n=1 Tax=Nocardia sp. SSK8 TaxID=3120154 RepID=UPI00300A6E69